MRWFCLIAALFAGASVAAETPDIDTCVSCHLELGDDKELIEPVHLMERDIHSRQGLSCADCHGGDPTSDDEDDSMDEDAGFIGMPDKGDMPQFCGKCHSDAEYIRQYNPALRVDQVALYQTSVHGRLLRQEGDENVASCIDCHSAHGILPAADPRSSVYAANVPQTCARCHGDPIYMQEYGIPTDQYEKYSKSVHGRPLIEEGDSNAPACNDCHGNHGATPPGVKSLANVCGQCHPLNNQLVNESPHRPAFEKLKIAACKTCHNHHAIEKPGDFKVGDRPPAICIKCHKTDKWPKGLEGAGRIRAALDSLNGAYRAAEEIVVRAERAGMEVGEALFELNEVAGHLTKTRTNVHSFDPEKVAALSSEGIELAIKVQEMGEAALGELRYRRKGLILSLAVIALLGAALFVKIRTVDRESRDH